MYIFNFQLMIEENDIVFINMKIGKKIIIFDLIFMKEIIIKYYK